MATPGPLRAGVGLKTEHYREILESEPAVGFFEVHAENYMGAGGPPHRYLEAIRSRYPVSLHGVGLSIGADRALDTHHLERLRTLCTRYEPLLFSEHLAWSSHEAGYLNDLLPVPYNEQTLDRVCEHVEQVQESLGRRMLLENPATYVSFLQSDIPETEFLAAIAARTGCGLLLDVNNVYVSAVNQGFDPLAYLVKFPVHAVGEVHLAGHAESHDDAGRRLLIDDHGSAVRQVVWKLYDFAIARLGPAPTLIEWDNELPDWQTLHAEAGRADLARWRAASPRTEDVADVAVAR
ncbi:MAG: DUF692 domain-containing protein [Steroidobacteraceae bacterium]